MSFLDKIVVAIIQVIFIAGIVFFIDRVLNCYKRVVQNKDVLKRKELKK
jgi:hypothetical protein